MIDSKNKNFYDLVFAMTVSEIKARYKHAMLGFLWVILLPLAQMIVIAFLFRFVIKTTVENYYLFVFTGLLLWNFFVICLTKGTTSIVDQRSLITKSKFPREAIPLSVIFSNLFHYMISNILLLVFVIFVGEMTFAKLLLSFLAVIWTLILTIGLVFWLSSHNVRYRDVSYFLQVVLQVLFYATPVLYPIAFIPQSLKLLFLANPLTSPVMLLQHSFSGADSPDLQLLLSNLIITGVIFFMGIRDFSNLKNNFDDWI